MRYRYEGQIAETVTFIGDKGDSVEAYAARPLGAGPFPGVVVIHHNPGWDEWTKEVARKFAHHGYNAIAPHLFCRRGPGETDDLSARSKAAGGEPDDQVVADCVGAARWLRDLGTASGKVGVIGFCSGGRHTYLCATRAPDQFDAAVNCWGNGVVVDDKSQLTPGRPVAPIDYTPSLKAPMLGIFGNEDRNPSPDHVNRLEAELKQLGKSYEFHRYDGAGHGFFGPQRPGYRIEQAIDGWKKVMAFFGNQLR